MPGSTETTARAAVEVLHVTYCRNPLRPLADRQVHRLAATGADTVDSLVKRLGLQGCCLLATLNDVLSQTLNACDADRPPEPPTA